MFVNKPMGGFGPGMNYEPWKPKQETEKSFTDFSSFYRLNESKKKGRKKLDDMISEEDLVNGKEKCYFQEKKCLTDIHNRTAMASKASLFIALKRWKTKATNSYRVKGYSTQYKLRLQINKGHYAVKPRESYLNYVVKIRVAQYRTETSPLEETVYYMVPDWDEQFDFYLDSLDYPLELKIVERDKFGDHFVGRCSTDLFEFGIGEKCVVVKPLECKRGIASKLNGQLEFTVVIENASDTDQRQFELKKQEAAAAAIQAEKEEREKRKKPNKRENSTEDARNNHSNIQMVDIPDSENEREQSTSSSPGKAIVSRQINGTRGKLKRDKTVDRSSEQDLFSSSSHDSFPPDRSAVTTRTVEKLRKSSRANSKDSLANSRDNSRTNSHGISRFGSQTNSRDGSNDLLVTSCDATLLRQAKKELNPSNNPEIAGNRPYRKLSLTPNLPRLEQRTSLNNHPLQKHTHKFSTSEESDLYNDSDQNIFTSDQLLSPTTQSNPIGVVPTIITHSPSDNEAREPIKIIDSHSPTTSSSSSLKSKGSATSASRVKFDTDTSSCSTSASASQALNRVCEDAPPSGNQLTRRPSIFHSSPSLSGGTVEGEIRSRTFSEGANRAANSEREAAPETDLKFDEISVVEKRKTFAFKNMKRKQNMLAPKVLTDIGERSDNSDQSFDYGDGGVGAGVMSTPAVDDRGGSSATPSEAMFRSKSREESSLEIYVLRLTVITASDLPLVESFVKVKVGSIHKKTPVCKGDGGSCTWGSTLEYYVNKTELSAHIQVCDKDAFQEAYGQGTVDMTSHPLDTEKHHKVRLRGPKGNKIQTCLVLSTVLERTDKSTATKMMKKRAKSFSKKDFKRSLSRARSSISHFKDKTLDGLSGSSNLKSEVQSTYTESTKSLNFSSMADSNSFVSSESFDEPTVKLAKNEKGPPNFRLHVQFYECGNLCGKGSKQFFDTFVKLKIGEQEFKTRTVKKNANPKFNESFEFNLYDLSEPLRVRVYQISRLFDEILGTSKVRLSVLPFDTDLNINEFPVITDEARFKCHNPNISLGIRLSCLASKVVQQPTNGLLPSRSRFESTQSNVIEQDSVSLYRVYINMFRGVDLLAFDETGTSDPYVLLRIGSIQHQTDVIYHSLAPTWNENFMFSVNSLDKDLHLTVVDKDPEYDDLMANYRTHLGDIPLQTRCEFEIDLENDSGKLEFSVLIQRAEDPMISTIPYVGYSAVPIATLEIKPIGLAQHEKNQVRQNYRLEVCIGKETYSIFYEGPGQGSWNAIDIYDSFLESVTFKLYMVQFGLQEKLMASIEEDMGSQSTSSNSHVTLDIPEISNMFLLCFTLKYTSYETGSCLTPVEYDEEKSFEEMTFDELGDALSCPYNYALYTERISLKSAPSSILDNDIHCGFIFRLEQLPRTLTLKLFKRTSNFSTYLGATDFSITCGSEGVLKGDMVLETDNSTIKLALIFDVIQHIHQDIINTMTTPSVPILKPDADELALLNNFKKLTYCYITLQIFLRHTTSIRRMGSYKKILLLLVSLFCVVNIPPEYTELTLPAFISAFIVIVSFRLVWNRGHLSEMRLALLEEINTCSVDEAIFIRTCDKTVSRVNDCMQKIIYVYSWNSPVASTIFLIKLIVLASLFILLPEQLCFLIFLIILISHRTPFEYFVSELLNLVNPLNGVPNNICS
ncbi:hypothetical protein ACHWQZ_G009739 [Mnemiopsis leidyi]